MGFLSSNLTNLKNNQKSDIIFIENEGGKR
nr:MAG TPA: hypothetical protein [Caudoviricetes sp.]